jgi:cell division protein FtsI/penicillin-binding protein 2
MIVSPRDDRLEDRAERMGRPVGPVNARDIGDMMVSAVQGGTGTAVQIPGYRIGGKTEPRRPASRGRTRRGSSHSPASRASGRRSRSPSQRAPELTAA